MRLDTMTDVDWNVIVAFAKNDMNSQRTADSIYMHRNNVIYHIGRICDIFSLDLEDPGQRLRLLLLYRLGDLLSAGEL